MIDDKHSTVRQPRPILPWLFAISALTFALGMLFNPWFEQTVRAQLPGAFHQPDVGSIAASTDELKSALAALETRVAALETRPAGAALAGAAPALNEPAAVAADSGMDVVQTAGLAARLDALDRNQSQNGTRIDNLSAEVASLNVKIELIGSNAAASLETAAVSAEKARGVLLVTAARRAAEQGQSLAVLEPALRRQFGADNSAAVDSLLSASRDAPTLGGLKLAFARLRPSLSKAPQPPGGSGWWAELKASVADVVTVRKPGGSAANSNEARVKEIAARLDRGDVTGALLMLRRLPTATQRLARDWRLDAEAYAATYGALQQLEADVLLEDEDLPLQTSTPESRETL